MQYVAALLGLLLAVTFFVWISAATYFYFRKFDAMLKIIDHPWAEGRSKHELGLRQQLNVCTSLAMWLSRPQSNSWLGKKNRALFSHLNASDIPRDIKLPLLVAYWAMWIGCAVLLAAYVLKKLSE